MRPGGAVGKSCSAIAPLFPNLRAFTTEISTLPASASAIGGMVRRPPTDDTIASPPSCAAGTFCGA